MAGSEVTGWLNGDGSVGPAPTPLDDLLGQQRPVSRLVFWARYGRRIGALERARRTARTLMLRNSAALALHVDDGTGSCPTCWEASPCRTERALTGGD